MGKAVAAIECNHMPTGIAFADAALKAANVSLIGYELSKKAGGVVIKLEGEVSALRAAVDAGRLVADTLNGISGISFIPRPMECMDMMFRNKDTVGYEPDQDLKPDQDPDPDPEPVPVAEAEPEALPAEEEAAEEAEVPEEIDAADETDLTAEPEEEVLDAAEPAGEKAAYTCNICQDPACPRRKGELRSLCIHFNE